MVHETQRAAAWATQFWVIVRAQDFRASLGASVALAPGAPFPRCRRPPSPGVGHVRLVGEEEVLLVLAEHLLHAHVERLHLHKD